jgi:hypothetical protein
LITFFGTSYFDQPALLRHLTFAMLPALHLLKKEPEESLKAASEPKASMLDMIAANQGTS